MTKRLVIGITTTTRGSLGISHGQVLRLFDTSTVSSAFQVSTLGWLLIGTLKSVAGVETGERGAGLIFTNDTDSELVMDIDGHAFMYEFFMNSAFAPSGVIGLEVTVDAGATVEWARFQSNGMNTPFTKYIQRVYEGWAGTGSNVLGNTEVLTVADIKTMPMYTAWCRSEIDQSVVEAITGKADTDIVRIIVEEAT